MAAISRRDGALHAKLGRRSRTRQRENYRLWSRWRDRLAKAPARGPIARFAGLLVAVVVMVVQPWSLGLAAIVPMAKYQPSAVLKPIIVFNATPYIDISNSCPVIDFVSGREVRRSSLDFSLGQNQNGSFFFNFNLFKILLVAVLKPANFYIVSNISCWQISRINDRDIRDSCFIIDHFVKFAGYCAQISPLDDFGLIGLRFGSFSCDNPKFVGGPPQSSSKSRQDYSESRSDKPFVLVSYVSNPSDTDEDGSVEGGAVFFGFLVICAAAGLISYWVASKQ